MKKKITIFGVISLLAAISCLSFMNDEGKSTDLTSRNIEALSNGEGPSAIGCKPSRKSTCYIFDGSGMLVDKDKNKYPGN